MPDKAIKFKVGFTYLELEEKEVSKGKVRYRIRLSEKKGNDVLTLEANIMLHHVKQLHLFTGNILQERQEEISTQERLVARRMERLEQLYRESESLGFFTLETIEQLSALDIPVISFLAAELRMSAQELKDYLALNNLPFIFFKNLYQKGKEIIDSNI